jgi:hypothetical protein
MLLKVARTCKRPGATEATEGLLARVHSFVFLQMAGLEVGFWTLGTAEESFLPCARFLSYPEIIILGFSVKSL